MTGRRDDQHKVVSAFQGTIGPASDLLGRCGGRCQAIHARVGAEPRRGRRTIITTKHVIFKLGVSHVTSIYAGLPRLLFVAIWSLAIISSGQAQDMWGEIAPASGHNPAPADNGPMNFAAPANQPQQQPAPVDFSSSPVAAQPGAETQATMIQPQPHVAAPYRMAAQAQPTAGDAIVAENAPAQADGQQGPDAGTGTQGGGENDTNLTLGQIGNTWSRAVFQNDRAAQQQVLLEYIPGALAIIGVMILANWLGSRFGDYVASRVSKQVDVTLGVFAGKVTRTIVLLLTLMSVLSYFNVETAGLAAAIAAVGFTVGMALQGTLGNFASGISLLVFRPFNVGDFVVVDGTEGIVNSIELFTTTIDTLDHRHVIIPNGKVFGSKIENWSHNECRRVEVVVGVDYNADMAFTRQVLEAAVSNISGAWSSPAPEVYLAELNTSSVDWACRVWVPQVDSLAVRERLVETVKVTLDHHSISIAYPQLDLHVVPPVAGSALRKPAA